jgi:RNA polymerase sigma-70 factor (ECF subfamily)
MSRQDLWWVVPVEGAQRGSLRVGSGSCRGKRSLAPEICVYCVRQWPSGGLKSFPLFSKAAFLKHLFMNFHVLDLLPRWVHIQQTISHVLPLLINGAQCFACLLRFGRRSRRSNCTYSASETNRTVCGGWRSRMQNLTGEASRRPSACLEVSEQVRLLATNNTPSCGSPLGDESVFNQLYRQYSPTVYSVALRVLKDPSEAEDVLQDVFLRIWTRPASSTVLSEHPKKWFETVSRNRAIDMLRRKILFDTMEEIPTHPPVNPFEAVDCDLLLTRTRFLIRRLPPLQREAVEMAFYRELTHAEIAHRLKTPLGTIKTRIRSGMHALSISIRG